MQVKTLSNKEIRDIISNYLYDIKGINCPPGQLNFVLNAGVLECEYDNATKALWKKDNKLAIDLEKVVKNIAGND